MKTITDTAAPANCRAVIARQARNRRRGLLPAVFASQRGGPVPLATYYRWFSKLLGVDTEFRFAGRTKDPLKEFADQPSAGTLEVYCEATNEAGPGVESATSSINLA